MNKKQWYEILFENYGQKYDQESFTKVTIGECDFIEKELDFIKRIIPLVSLNKRFSRRGSC